MAKKQTIILSHGSQRPSEEVIKSLKLGEVLVQHAEKAEDAALHTIIGTSGESAQLVSFPSKEYVDSVATSNSAVTALDTRLDAAEGKIDTISGATETNKTNIAKNAEDIAKNAEAIAKNAEDILTKADKSVVEGINTRLVAAEETITAHTESISANTTAIANAQTAITANAQAIAKKADITALTETNEAVEAVGARVDKLVGDVEGDGDKSVRNIAAEEVAKVVANAPESFDTLKEIADWIQNDETGAADMANDIAELQKIVSGYTTGATIKSAVDALAEKVETNETNIETVSGLTADNKANIETISGDVETNKTNIAANAEAITKKADITTVNALTERVAANEDAIELINTTIEDNELVTSNALNDLDGRVKANLDKIDGEIERALGAEDALDKAIDALDAAAIKEIVANDAAGNSIVSKEGNKVTLDFSSFVIDGGEY